MPELTDPTDLREKLLEEARSRMRTPPGEDEITLTQFSEEMGCNRRKAGRILNGMVEDGTATVRENGTEGGRRCKVYRYKE